MSDLSSLHMARFYFLLSVALSVKFTSFCSTFASTMWAGWILSDVVVLLFLLGIVGEIGESNDEYYIWTHKKLDIGYNGDQIVDVTLTSESKTKLSPNAKISFTSEVKQSLLLVLCTINIIVIRTSTIGDEFVETKWDNPVHSLLFCSRLNGQKWEWNLQEDMTSILIQASFNTG